MAGGGNEGDGYHAVDMVVVEENAGWTHAENTWAVVEKIKAGTPKVMKRNALFKEDRKRSWTWVES